MAHGPNCELLRPSSYFGHCGSDMRPLQPLKCFVIIGEGGRLDYLT